MDWCYTMIPKCYTLKNTMYNAKNDILQVRENIRNWMDKIQLLHEDKMDTILENIMNHLDDEDLPYCELYQETLEGWKLIRHRNKLKKEYPRQFQHIVMEEKREIRESVKMMREDTL
jgi:hypothetical protein